MPPFSIPISLTVLVKAIVTGAMIIIIVVSRIRIHMAHRNERKHKKPIWQQRRDWKIYLSSIFGCFLFFCSDLL